MKTEAPQEQELLCPRCGQVPEDSTKNGWRRCINNHLWRDQELIARDEACEAALDAHIDGLSMGEIWAFREAWKLSAEHYTRAVPVPDEVMPKPRTERDWIEDYTDEDNGCYQHVCDSCGKTFHGHKRRTGDCKKCWQEFAVECIKEHHARSVPVPDLIEAVQVCGCHEVHNGKDCFGHLLPEGTWDVPSSVEIDAVINRWLTVIKPGTEWLVRLSGEWNLCGLDDRRKCIFDLYHTKDEVDVAHTHRTWQNTLRAFARDLLALSVSQQWIPIRSVEDLPKGLINNTKFEITTRWGDVEIDEWMPRQNCWRNFIDTDVIAYRPLLEPYMPKPQGEKE